MSKRPSPWAKADSVGGIGFRKAPPTSSLPGLRPQLTDSPSRGEWLVGALQRGGVGTGRDLSGDLCVRPIAYAFGRIAVFLGRGMNLGERKILRPPFGVEIDDFCFMNYFFDHFIDGQA